jgi:NAD dependent epimerase/dehydratase family enzyme
MRFGVILSARGGALAKMRLPFKLGAGGPIGTGRQGVSWIALDDAIYAIHHLIRHDEIAVPVNVVGPVDRRKRELATALGPRLHRPAVVPLPARSSRSFRADGGGAASRRSARRARCAAPLGFTWSVRRLSRRAGR